MRTLKQAKEALKADRRRARISGNIIKRMYSGIQGLRIYSAKPDGTVIREAKLYF